MAFVIERAQNNMAESANIDRTGGERHGKSNLDTAKKDRQAARDNELKKHEELRHLIDKAEAAEKQSWLDDFTDWLNGVDREGEVQEAQARAQTDIEKSGKIKELAGEQQRDVLANMSESNDRANAMERSAKQLLDTHAEIKRSTIVG